MKKYIKPTANVIQIKLEKIFALSIPDSPIEEDATGAAMTRRRMWLDNEEEW